MAFKTIDVTLGAGATRVTTTHTPVRQFFVYNITGNGAVSVGTSTVAVASFGHQVAAGATGPSVGPFAGELPMNLEDVWLLGTQNNVIHITYVT